MTTVIKAENLGKKYLIRHQQQSSDAAFTYLSFRDTLTKTFSGIKNRLFNPLTKKNRIETTDKGSEEFWALKNLDFEIKQGERVGIIGSNGAGKSTLLKLISRITDPSTGKLKIKGRVASLLEVGTGFHPELTGRENIFLNGAILGMTKKEIKSKFDEIVAFAEIEKFLDTPVKRYSSGMYVRLAFAVAAHLEPEILIIDEILAVGDAQFQRKCLGRMEDIGNEGRTIIFVSHGMATIEQLCNSAIYLEKGEIKARSKDVREVVKMYLTSGESGGKLSLWTNSEHKYQNPYFELNKIYISGKNDIPLSGSISNDAGIRLNLELEIKKINPNFGVGYYIYNEWGQLVYFSSSVDRAENDWPRFHMGACRLWTDIPGRFLNEGEYRVEIIANINGQAFIIGPRGDLPMVMFEIKEGMSDSPFWFKARDGVVAPILRWECD